MRKLLLALFATAAAVPALASAQESEGRDDRARFENRSEIGARAGNERARPQNPDRAETPRFSRPDRPERVERATPPAAASPEARPDRRGGIVGAWNRDRANPAPAPQPVQVAPNSPRQRDDGRRNWNGNTGRTDGNRNDGVRRDWNRNDRNDNRADRNRNDGRNWDRNNDGRPDWNRNNSDRRDWNGNRGWNGNDRNVRNWDRSWRNNNRYDWQRYRSSNRYAFRLPRYAAPYNWSYGYRRFSIGAYLFADLFARDYWIDDPWAYRLPPVYWPYQWVRYYNDALLIDTRTGYVVDSIPDIFWY